MNISEIAKKVILFASKEKIRLIPNNYRVLFDYFIGKSNIITTSIDRHLKQKDQITQEILDEIYDNSYDAEFDDDTAVIMQNEIDAAREVAQEAIKILAEALSQVIANSEENSSYSESLTKYSKKAESADSIDAIRDIIKSMVQDTTEMTKRSASFREKLENSQEELKTLQEELKAAKGEARIDALTHLYNRRHFDESLMGAIKYVQAENSASLILIDIDHFKNFNDSFGHDVGDNLLKAIAKKMKASITARCTLCRYGGEEFIILCHGMKLHRAEELAEELRKSVWEWDFIVKDKKAPVTISLGVSEIRGDDDMATPVKRADSALYMSKEAGRNSVTTEKDIADAKKSND